jgi:hypothetical protein
LNYILTDRIDTNIKQWVVLLPQLDNPKYVFPFGGFPESSVFSRGLNGRSLFKVFSDKGDRQVASWISGVLPEQQFTCSKEGVRNESSAVLMVYPSVVKGAEFSQEKLRSNLHIGFGIQFPDNNCPTQLFYKK